MAAAVRSRPANRDRKANRGAAIAIGEAADLKENSLEMATFFALGLGGGGQSWVRRDVLHTAVHLLDELLGALGITEQHAAA